MQTRRYYPSWLPPNPRERDALLKMRHQQIAAIVWLVALAPVGWTSVVLTGLDMLFGPLTILWLLVGLALARRITIGVCPRCGGRFCEKQDPPYWHGLMIRRCDNCGLTLDTEQGQESN
jgi:hypothetical protein